MPWNAVTFDSNGKIKDARVSSEDGYPRLGAYRIGTRNWGSDSTDLANNSKLHFIIINGQQYRGSSFVTAVEDFLDDVLALNGDLTVYEYTDLQESGQTGTWELVFDKLNDETGPSSIDDWWVYDEDGNKVSTFAGADHTNITTHVTVDASGNRFPKWYGQSAVTPVLLDPHNSGGTRLHVYNDVNDHRVRSNNQDYDRNGTDDEGKADWNTPETRGFAAADEFREGHKLYAQALIVETSDLKYIGNILTHSAETQIIDPDDPGYPPLPHNHYGNLLRGGLIEALSREAGFPFSGIFGDGTRNGSFGNFRIAMASYLYGMRECIAPRHVLCEWHIDITTGERNPVVGTDITAAAMEVARYGCCFAWLDDGYVGLADDISFHNRTVLHDYMGVVNTGTTGLSREWFGPAIDLPLRTIEENTGVSGVLIDTDNDGVFMRRYQNALVILASSNLTTGTKTIPVVEGGSVLDGEIPSGVYKEIDGYQDDSVDQGRVVNTTNFPAGYTMNKRDGRVLEVI